MIESWILKKIEPLAGDPLIILRDPQRMLQPGAHVVDGWAEEHGYTVPFCAGNLALREMYEAARGDPEARFLVVDRSRENAKLPLFYPDLDAQAGRRHEMELSLRDFLVEKTGDVHWPDQVNERNLSRLLLTNLEGTLEAHGQLRAIHSTRFSDSDLHRIALGANLGINPFQQLSAGDVRRLVVEQHSTLEELNGQLPREVMQTLQEQIARVPKPFCWLLERDPQPIVRAFTLAALMHQHGLEYQLLLTNLDPALHDYREIDPQFLEQAMQDQLKADADRVLNDVRDAEQFLEAEPHRLRFLLHERLQIDKPEQALAVLRRERLSLLVRSMALLSLLTDLIENRALKFHEKVVALLNEQSAATDLPAMRRPTEQWQQLESIYRRTLEVYRLTNRLAQYTKQLQVKSTEELAFKTFDKLWNEERLNRLDYYLSDLDRGLRVGNIRPIPLQAFWPELRQRWEDARNKFAEAAAIATKAQNIIDRRFQDLYRKHYTTWIQQSDAPVVFTHQFLPRLLKAHWDPQSGRKAVIMVFDGLRSDAWDEFLRPVFEERFDLVARRPGSAILPTETQLSRKAISAGCLPNAFTSQRELDLLERWLEAHMGLKPQFEVRVDDDTIDAGISVRYVSDQIEYIVFSFTDKKLHNNDSPLALVYGATVATIIREDVRSVLRELPDDALIFITSDHGFMPVPEPTVTIPKTAVVDHHDVKYRNARTTSKLSGDDEEKVVDFDVRQMDIPDASPTVKGQKFSYVLFPRPGYTLRRPYGHKPSDRYTHGGLSLAECLVPMVVMGPRQKERPWLIIKRLTQVGSVSEGEELTIQLSIVPTRLDLEDVTVTLNFSLDELPERKEIFRGHEQTYTIRWTPKLEDVGDDEREKGEKAFAVTAVVSYMQEGKTARVSETATVRVKLDPTRLRRRIDSKLDFLMGKVPKTLK